MAEQLKLTLHESCSYNLTLQESCSYNVLGSLADVQRVSKCDSVCALAI